MEVSMSTIKSYLPGCANLSKVRVALSMHQTSKLQVAALIERRYNKSLFKTDGIPEVIQCAFPALLVADDLATEAKVMLVKSDSFPVRRLRI
jgi:hypothetical protein